MTSCNINWHHHIIKPVNCLQIPAKRMHSTKFLWGTISNKNQRERVVIVEMHWLIQIYLHVRNYMALVVHARSWTISKAACNINWCICAASSLCHQVMGWVLITSSLWGHQNTTREHSKIIKRWQKWCLQNLRKANNFTMKECKKRCTPTPITNLILMVHASLAFSFSFSFISLLDASIWNWEVHFMTQIDPRTFP